jgi:ATP-dependent DNA helicase PIF1
MLCELIQAASLIIWDETLMTQKIGFEALERMLRDIISTPSSANAKLPFGGKVVVLGGDLRQTLSIIQGGSHSEITCSTIVNFVLWSYIVVLHHRSNIRPSAHGLIEEGKKELADSSRWMLDIGEGNIEAIAKEDETEASWIKIPDELLLRW